MIRRGALLTVAAVALAGCSSAKPAPEPTRSAAVADAGAAQRAGGWDRIFAQPADMVGAVNQYGFNAGPYAKAASGGYQTRGTPIFASGSAAAQPNRIGFEASGATGQAFDTVAFTLDITDPANAGKAKQQFATVLRDALWQFSAPGAGDLTKSIASEAPATSTVDGVRVTLARTPIEAATPDARRITVTFARPGTNSGTSTPRNA